MKELLFVNTVRSVEDVITLVSCIKQGTRYKVEIETYPGNFGGHLKFFDDESTAVAFANTCFDEARRLSSHVQTK